MTAGTATGRTLVLGGARSGKSRHAQLLAEHAGPAPWTYIATAEALDPEMEQRIAAHRRDRGPDWRTVEAPHDLATALAAAAAPDRVVLVDCLTLWLSNRLLADADLAADSAALEAAFAAAPGTVICVANEVGLGIVPDNALARRFRDAAGRLNQLLAARADRVLFMAAGLPLSLKGDSPPLAPA
ncbi:bifunctional adenosylcobinamide kinase/adenosylcobinamide-phosphate guanylyltransferase [Marinibaculum pumilum]|uniref:Bifunctional adenosylcobalamin biosynthesis protein n=1 Tax=Marinibaculum pumilum TaxID=1766165 RepID=A0ABV7L791_9PROT